MRESNFSQSCTTFVVSYLKVTLLIFFESRYTREFVEDFKRVHIEKIIKNSRKEICNFELVIVI